MKQGICETTASSASSSELRLERVNAFSDGVFAIIITIMVLDLKKPGEASFKALLQLWPTWVSYIASYVLSVGGVFDRVCLSRFVSVAGYSANRADK